MANLQVHALLLGRRYLRHTRMSAASYSDELPSLRYQRRYATVGVANAFVVPKTANSPLPGAIRRRPPEGLHMSDSPATDQGVVAVVAPTDDGADGVGKIHEWLCGSETFKSATAPLGRSGYAWEMRHSDLCLSCADYRAAKDQELIGANQAAAAT
jgi:hypothetical protein